MSIDYSFLTADMVMSGNLVPATYAGKDVRLLYSASNPVHLGWFVATDYGHQRITLTDLIESILGKPLKPYDGNDIDPDRKVVSGMITEMETAYMIADESK